MKNIQAELVKTNNIISKTILQKVCSKLDQTLLNLGKTRVCCETCLVKIQKSQNGEWIKCNHETKTIPRKIKSSNCSKIYQDSYSTIKKKQHNNLLKYNLLLKKQSLLIQQSNAKSVKNQIETKPVKIMKKEKVKTKTILKKNNYTIFNDFQYGQIKHEILPPIECSQCIVSKQNHIEDTDTIVQNQYQPIKLKYIQNCNTNLKNQNLINLQDQQNGNNLINIKNDEQNNKQQELQQQSLLENEDNYQQNQINSIKQDKSSFYHLNDEHTRLKQSTKTNQQTMTEINNYEQSNKQYLIDFQQFKQCCDRFYSLLHKGKSSKLIYKYQENYQTYIKIMEDKFLKSRQNLLQLESSVQQLERKADKYFMKNVHSNSPYNSKRQSLEVDPFHLLLSSVNEEPQMQNYQKIDHMNSYFHLLLTQANTIQQLIDVSKAQKSLEQLIN